MTIIESPPSSMPTRAADPRVRGTTTVSRVAIEKIIGRAAGTTPGVSASRVRGVKGWFHTPAPGDVATHVDDTSSGQTAALDVCIDYPLPVRDVVDEVRRRVMAAAHEQIGLDVDRIDVVVTQLRRAERRPVTARRVR